MKFAPAKPTAKGLEIVSEPIVWTAEEALPSRARKRSATTERHRIEQEEAEAAAPDASPRLEELPALMRDAGREGRADHWLALRVEQLMRCGMAKEKATERAKDEATDGCLGMLKTG